MQDMRDREKIVCANHIGIGLNNVEAVEALVRSLTQRGAEIMPRSDPHKHKYFLRLNPGDIIELEIFFDDEGVSAHVDYTVEDLEGVQSEHGMAVYDYGIPDMLFIDVPGMPYLYPFTFQLGFAKR